MLSLTIFNSRFDNKTDKRVDLENWDQLVKLLHKLSQRPLKGKTDAELISPAVYTTGTTRANKNVLAWAGWAAVDVDDIEVNGELNAFVSQLAGSWRYVCYSTASSKCDKPKFRLVFELDRPIPVAEIKHFWFALQSHLDERGDKQCKDLSRMYYVPAQYAEAYNFIFSGGNDPISVDELLAKYPYAVKERSENFLDRLPEEWAKQVIEHRKNSLTNDTYRWTDYKDCPFVNKKMLQEYMSIASIDGSGRYRMIYKIMISIASAAIEKGYPITELEIVELIRQIDRDSSNKYQNRALDVEASNALEYAYKHGDFNVTR